MKIKEIPAAYIKKLIDDYFEGKTTGEEENILHQYFSQADIDPSLKEYKVFFETFHQLSTLFQTHETNHKEIYSNTSIVQPNKPYIRRLISLSSIAASVAAIFLIVFFISKSAKTSDFVIIDGVKYTDSKKIEAAMNNSLENVKIETQDIFSEFNDLDLESIK
jgi:hypothetical protein